MYFLLFLVCFLALFLISRALTMQLGSLLLRFTRSTTIAIHLLSFFFFPGVMIHELAHFFMANILFVPTGTIEFFPKIQEGGVKLGSVTIAKTDPVRRVLIGVAPVLGGLGILFLASYYLTPLWPLSIKSLLFAYVLFEVGNTMFSSKKDLEGALGFVFALAFLLLCLFIIGTRVPISFTTWLLWFFNQQIFLQMSFWLISSCLVNVCVLGLFKLTSKR